MDFNTLGSGSPFYLLRKGEKPTLFIGSVKEKSAPMPKYQGQIFNGTPVQQVVSITANINGKDEVFSDIPFNVEIAARGNDTFSGSREAMLSAVDAMIQSSRKSLEMVDYHKAVLDEGEKMLETLNPRYAEEKKRDKNIVELNRRQAATDEKIAATDKKISDLATQNSEILAILRQLTGASKDKA